jgi:hypothetical protein
LALLEVVAQPAKASDEHTAGKSEPRPEDENQQHGLVIHGRQKRDAQSDQRR